MRILKKVITVVVICIVVGVFVSCDAFLDGVDDIVIDELDRIGAQPTDYAMVAQILVPETLTEWEWDLKAMVCERGGYDLNPYTGQTLIMTSVNINAICSADPVRIHVFSTEEEIACAYLSVREHGMNAPGLWSVNDVNCTLYHWATPCN